MGKARRPFATGSKPGPDALDHYLEENGYYRKHVARDPSSLFRVVAELVLDIQDYHQQVRQDCASYMEQRSREYANEVDKNYYNYIAALHKLRTPGSLLELRVMARMYKKNIILFEPNQNYTMANQRVYVKNENYDTEPLRIYYSHKDKHFDIVYTLDYTEKLAETQSIVYEILYSNVYKLPDVMYAVERMLHDQKGEFTMPLPDDDTKYETVNGDIIEFDKAENTNCVLKDPDTCHFHNQKTFDEMVKKNQDSIVIINRSDDPGHLRIVKPIDGYLYKSEISCVRQLLEENITPFPFKVAKALDPSIYRNTEFELWQDSRKQSRLKWSDFDDKLFVYGNDQYQYLPYDPGLTPIKVMDEPSLLEQFTYVTKDDDFMKVGKFNYDKIIPTREHLEPIVMPMHYTHQNGNNNNYRNNRGRRTFYNNNHRFQHNNNNQEERERFHYQEHEAPPPIYAQNSNYGENSYQFMPGYDQNSSPPIYPNPPLVQYMPSTPYQPVPIPLSYATNNHMISYPNYQQPPPVPLTFENPPPSLNIAGTTVKESDNSGISGDFMNLIRDGELAATNNINLAITESIDPTGSDLPMNNMNTLRLAYNIGVRYLTAAGLTQRVDTVTATMENLTVRDEEQQQQGSSSGTATVTLKPDNGPPPPPNNTPVAPKLSGHNSGHNFVANRNYNGNGGNFRRFNNYNSKRNNYYNNGGNNNRKEIQFNSNVKNVHKAETNLNKNGGNYGNVASSSIANHQYQHGNGHQNDGAHNNGITKATSVASTLLLNSPDGSGTSESIGYASEQSARPNIYIPPPQIPMAPPSTPQFYQVSQYATPQPPQYVCYAQGENGEYFPLQQQYQAPVYYSPGPHAPVYYPPQNYINHSMYTNDSGVSEVPYAAHPYYAQVYQQPGPIYYPQTPQVPPIVHSHQVVTTPIIQHPVQAPVYPVAVSQNVNGVTGEEDGEVVTSSSGVVASTNLDVQAEASNADA